MFFSFIDLISTKLEIEDLYPCAHPDEDFNVNLSSSLVLALMSIALIARMIILHRPFDQGKKSSSK